MKYKVELTGVAGLIEKFSMVLDVPVVSFTGWEMYQTVDCHMKSELIPFLSKL